MQNGENEDKLGINLNKDQKIKKETSILVHSPKLQNEH